MVTCLALLLNLAGLLKRTFELAIYLVALFSTTSIVGQRYRTRIYVGNRCTSHRVAGTM